MTRAEAEEMWKDVVGYTTRKCAEIGIPYEPSKFRQRVYIFEQLSGEAVPTNGPGTSREQWLKYWADKFRQYRRVDAELETLLIEYIQELRHGQGR